MPYIVARTWEPHSTPVDYLHKWDDEFGTVCSSKHIAKRFKTFSQAHSARCRAEQLVPELLGGTEIVYSVVPIDK